MLTFLSFQSVTKCQTLLKNMTTFVNGNSICAAKFTTFEIITIELKIGPYGPELIWHLG